MEQIISSFALSSDVLSCEPYGKGLLNRTFLLCLAGGSRLILQRVNRFAFSDIPGLMENFSAVTRVISQQTPDPRKCLRLIPTSDGKSFCLDTNGEYWRMMHYIEGSLCLQHPESPADFYQGAVAFGSFLRMLWDYPADTLHETIPDFHNTPKRFRALREALSRDRAHRAGTVRQELAFAFSRQEDADALHLLREQGKLPVRATHNDTKFNNVLLDAQTRTALCVIDLDTVMPGLIAYDFGDAIRSGAVRRGKSPSDTRLDLSFYRAFSNGFLASCPPLTETELKSLPVGAKLMTLECGVRFLTDYLNGDVYFSVDYPTQNLDRARSQFALLSDMERHFDEMAAIELP